jgi:hypothetical protein
MLPLTEFSRSRRNMTVKQQRSFWLSVSAFGIALSATLLGQSQPDSGVRIPLPTDWSHQHVIFSKPATADIAAKIEQDPRYWQQLYRREWPLMLPKSSVSQHDSKAATTQDWQESMGSGASSGATNYPAKFSFLGTTANCGNAIQPDFVTYNSGLSGSGTQASIVAYDNLYSGCTGTVPSVYWAYNTGGQVLTSPTYSLDGTQVAFVQTSGGDGSLVILRWAASTTETVGNPGAPTLESPASKYPGCTSPCMVSFLLTNSSGTPANDTASSVFYDYSSDIAYVGDSHGWLHKFTPVFFGTPAEARTGGWPLELNSTNPNALADPVFDFVSGNLFIGDAGGYLYLVNPKTPSVIKSGQLDHGVGVTQGPIVDPSSKYVYVFASSDGTTNCTGGVACAAVYQLSTNFTVNSKGTEVAVGVSTASGGTPNPMYLGAFDSTYINSKTSTGNLYVCGNTGADPTLYRVPIAAGVFGTPAEIDNLTPAADSPACSSITDIQNPNATGGAFERLYFGVENNGRPTACNGKGCAVSFIDAPWQASTSYQVGQEILVLRPANNTLYVNVVTVAGTTAATAPATWPAQVGATTASGSVTFLNQGATDIAQFSQWAKNHAYALHARIVDSNGNVEVVSKAGTSGANTPTWKTTAGANTTDGTVTWVNAGVLPSAALAAAGGTSGIIIDNFVNTLLGASQVYFSTLSNQTCTTSGTTGGCAVQASQVTLK